MDKKTIIIGGTGIGRSLAKIVSDENIDIVHAVSQSEIGTETDVMDFEVTRTANTKYYPVKGSKYHK